MSTSQLESIANTSNPARRFWTIVVPTVVTLLLMATAVFISYLEFVGTAVEGLELSPHTFKVRSFSYRQGFISGKQRGPIYRTVIPQIDFGPEMEKAVASYTYEERWDLIWDSTVQGDSPDWIAAPIETLDNAMSESYYSWGAWISGNSRFWPAWNVEHPNIAPTLWRAVAELAVHKQYVVIPELLDRVSRFEDDLEILAEIDRFLASRYSEMAERTTDSELQQRFTELAETPFTDRTPVLDLP